MKIKFIKSDLIGQTREGEPKYLMTLVKHGIAVEIFDEAVQDIENTQKEEKQSHETKELKHNPETKHRRKRKHV